MTIAWAHDEATRAEVARFFAANIQGDASYISHGEIQCGLSIDGRTWAGDLEARFLEDLSAGDTGPQLAVMRNGDGALVAAALVEWVDTPRVRFGVIEDLAVPAELRSSGLGNKMMKWIETEASVRNCRWLFLESGRNNLRAHRFFERHGFREMSHVFVKELDGTS